MPTRHTAYAVHNDGERCHIASSPNRDLVDDYVSYHKARMAGIADQHDWAREVRYVIEEADNH